MPAKVEPLLGELIDYIYSHNKKLMNKLKIGIVTFALVIAGTASAALVSYLSNDVTADVDIVSPVTMNINSGRDGSVNANTSLAINTTGNSSFEFTTVAKNNANNDIEGYRVVMLEQTAGGLLNGEEVTSVFFEHAWSGGEVDITSDLYVVLSDGSLMSLTNYIATDWENKKLILITSENGTDATVNDLEAGEADWNFFRLTLHPAVVGSYEISSQYVYDLTAYAAEFYSA